MAPFGGGITALALAFGLAAGATAAPAAPTTSTRSCGSTLVILTGHGARGEGQAHDIRATRVSCRRARLVAKQCVRDALRGWRISNEPQTPEMTDAGRTVLDRGEAHVTFTVVGGGGCA